jgi:hypothetical protein
VQAQGLHGTRLRTACVYVDRQRDAYYLGRVSETLLQWTQNGANRLLPLAPTAATAKRARGAAHTQRMAVPRQQRP